MENMGRQHLLFGLALLATEYTEDTEGSQKCSYWWILVNGYQGVAFLHA